MGVLPVDTVGRVGPSMPLLKAHAGMHSLQSVQPSCQVVVQTLVEKP